jgi:hypothetical protein
MPDDHQPPVSPLDELLYQVNGRPQPHTAASMPAHPPRSWVASHEDWAMSMQEKAGCPLPGLVALGRQMDYELKHPQWLDKQNQGKTLRSMDGRHFFKRHPVAHAVIIISAWVVSTALAACTMLTIIGWIVGPA